MIFHFLGCHDEHGHIEHIPPHSSITSRPLTSTPSNHPISNLIAPMEPPYENYSSPLFNIWCSSVNASRRQYGTIVHRPNHSHLSILHTYRYKLQLQNCFVLLLIGRFRSTWKKMVCRRSSRGRRQLLFKAAMNYGRNEALPQ